MSSIDVTTLLNSVRSGDDSAFPQLIEVVHEELRRMAAGKLEAEPRGHTLQPTALVNEAFLRLRGSSGDLEDRAHFFGAAARAMERVLIDYARRRRAQKRGGDVAHVTLGDLDIEAEDADLDILEVQEAVTALEGESPELAALVRYRYFLGLTLEQITQIEDTSLATLKRRWTFARAWLYERLQP